MIWRQLMTKLITAALIKFLDVDALAGLIAKAIANILLFASKRGGKSWDVAKAIIVKINTWTSLFLQVYDDETLTAAEEKTIADAIKQETKIEKLVDVLKNNINE